MKKIKILYSGGGTLGPVTPLLAIHEMLKVEYGENYIPLWVGTRKGIEQTLVQQTGIQYRTIAAGKLRRYISAWNFIDLTKMLIGFFQSFGLLLKENPSLCISAGGYVSVPLHWAAWLLGIPTWIHQQDVQIGLANKLMTPIARQITTVLEAQTKLFSSKKTVWLGNPIRTDILSGTKKQAQKVFNVPPNVPVVFATGGGTGSLRINQLIIEAIPHLRGNAQVLHLSGRERPQEMVIRAEQLFKDYYQVHQFFSSEMKQAYAVADVVISRGGFGTLSELAALKKPVIVIPKPGHQTENVAYFEKNHAVIQLDQEMMDGNLLAKTVKQLLENPAEQKRLGEKLFSMLPPAKAEKVVEIVKQLIS